MVISGKQWFLFLFVIVNFCVTCVKCEDYCNCYGAGSIALSVVLSVILTLILVGAIFYWIKNRTKTDQLILETDPEKGKSEYAFENHGFKDASLTTYSKPEKASSEKSKWTSHFSSSPTKSENQKKVTMDDSNLRSDEIKIVSLRSHDFAGLGFSIFGNMKEGIYIKDVLNRGPASESGKLNPGDRINSVTINFEHIVYEDAQNILSYASPYEVIIEAKNNGKIPTLSKNEQNQQNHLILHPIYRSSSNADLQKMHQMSTLERKPLNSENLKMQLEKKITPIETEIRLNNKVENIEKLQKSEQNHQRFGVKVFPTITAENGMKNLTEFAETKQIGEDVLDNSNTSEIFERNGSVNGSGLKRDSNGIPQELPSHMLNAAVAARRNRKSFDENSEILRKSKGKAPQPPKFEEKYNSNSPSDDSDLENDNNKPTSPTIELNSNDITIHSEENQNRKTASTGDLTKIEKNMKSCGTLERAQSLDDHQTVAQAAIQSKSQSSQNDIFDDENIIINREPRLSLILDGLNTFQRNRLKKSTEWGNLEDAILRTGTDDNSLNSSSSDCVEFDAVVNKIKEIKGETRTPNENEANIKVEPLDEPRVEVEVEVKNQIWPTETEKIIEVKTIKPVLVQAKQAPPNLVKEKSVVNEIWPSQIELEQSSKIHKRQQMPLETVSIPPPPISTTSEPEMIAQTGNEILKRNSETGEFYINNNNNYNSSDEIKSSTVEEPNSSTRAQLFSDEIFFNNDTNISDDLKVSRHITSTNFPSLDNSSNNISNVLITSSSEDLDVDGLHNQNNGSSSLHSLEFSINEFPQTILNDESITLINDTDNELFESESNKITITTPDLIKNVTITEAINTLNHNYDKEPSSINSVSNSLTFITEIQVSQPEPDEKDLDEEFEKYVKNFENQSQTHTENVGATIDNKDETIDAETTKKELNKIHEMVEEQLKKLPEMRFSTSYDQPAIEKSQAPRQSQIEVLRSNFEKPRKSIENNKSRIPISTSSIKTPSPISSPERRDSKNLENNSAENNANSEMFELSTTTTPKYQNSNLKTPKNITVTSIRNNSKIPSGLPVLGGKPAGIVSRKSEENLVDPVIIGSNNLSFKQWVFEPNNSSITNISLPLSGSHKQQEK